MREQIPDDQISVGSIDPSSIDLDEHLQAAAREISQALAPSVVYSVDTTTRTERAIRDCQTPAYPEAFLERYPRDTRVRDIKASFRVSEALQNVRFRKKKK